MLKFERSKSLAEVVTARLREEIVEGEFSLGQALSEAMIASRYEVSRTPVREAFACLALEGIIRTKPQQGTFVFTMDRTEFAQISETRSILETASLWLAMERNPERLVRQWRRLVSSMELAVGNNDAKRYSRYDGDFHNALFSLAGNPFLTSAAQSFAAKMAAVRNRLGSQPDHMRHSFEQHVELLRLVADNNTRAAAELLETHIRFKGEAFWAPMDGVEAFSQPRREAHPKTGRSPRKIPA